MMVVLKYIVYYVVTAENKVIAIMERKTNGKKYRRSNSRTS